MSYKKIILYLLLFLLLMIVIGLGIGFLSAFINETLSDHLIVFIFILMVSSAFIYLFVDHKKSQKKKPELLTCGQLIFGQRDGEFILSLFKAIDKDLQSIHQRMLFFRLGFDAYVYTVVNFKVFDEVTKKEPNAFYGVNTL